MLTWLEVGKDIKLFTLSNKDGPIIKTELDKHINYNDTLYEDEVNTDDNFYHFMSKSQGGKVKLKSDNVAKKNSSWEEDFKDLFENNSDDKVKTEHEDEEEEVEEFSGKSKRRRLKHEDEENGEEQSEEGELKCKHCPKVFLRPGLRRVHEQLHTKPFKCTECDASFGRKSNLVGHQRLANFMFHVF